MIGATTKSPRPVTGRMVLFCLIAFFAIVALANGLLVRFALTTFGGLETASSYQAGFAFEREAAAARAQDERHWQVSAKVLPDAGITVRPVSPPSAPELTQSLERAPACRRDGRGGPPCPGVPANPDAFDPNPPSGVKDEARWAKEKQQRWRGDSPSGTIRVARKAGPERCVP